MQEALWGQPDFANGGDLLLGASLGGQPPGGDPGFAPFAADAAAAAARQAAGGPGGAPAAVAAAGLFPQALGAAGPRQDILILPPMVPAASLGAAGSGGSAGGSGSDALGAAPPGKPLSKKEIARQKNREKQARFRARQKVGRRCAALHGARPLPVGPPPPGGSSRASERACGLAFVSTLLNG